MKKHFILASLVCSIAIANAQRGAADPLHNISSFYLGTSNIGFSHEIALSKSITINTAVALGRGYLPTENKLYSQWRFFNPSLLTSLNPRWYYNNTKRIQSGKSTRLNSGNYIGLGMSTASRNLRGGTNMHNSILLNVHWGLQRALADKWFLGGAIGGGYAQSLDYESGGMYPSLNAKFSYVISKKLRRKDRLREEPQR